jgi:hypothetical protein
MDLELKLIALFLIAASLTVQIGGSKVTLIGQAAESCVSTERQ